MELSNSEKAGKLGIDIGKYRNNLTLRAAINEKERENENIGEAESKQNIGDLEDKDSKIVTAPPFEKLFMNINNVPAGVPGAIKIGRDGKLLQRWFNNNGKVGSVIETFDYWSTRIYKKQIQAHTIKLLEGDVTFEDIKIDPPKLVEGQLMSPMYAINNALTYSGTLYATLVLNNGEIQRRSEPVVLGKIPIMLGSHLDNLRTMSDTEKVQQGMCTNEAYGDFIIKGRRLVVIMQEKLRLNRVLVYLTKSDEPICRLTLKTQKGHTIITLKQNKNSGGVIEVELPGLRKSGTSSKMKKELRNLNVFQVFRLLGVDNQLDVLNWVLKFTKPEYQHRVMGVLHMTLVDFNSHIEDLATLYEIREIPEKEETEKVKKETMDLFINVLFPNIPETDINKKLDMLSLMIVRFVEYLAGLRPLDDRDHLGNKRLESAGKSMETLFGGLFRELIKAIGKPKKKDKKMIRPERIDIKFDTLVKSGFKKDYMESSFIQSFDRADNWGVPGQQTRKENIVQQLKRDNYLTPFIQLSEINTPTTDKGKIMNVRTIHTSQLGYICPAHTPEGSRCGLVKHCALTNWVTYEDEDNEPIIFEKIKGKITDDKTAEHDTLVWFNGKIIGWCRGRELYNDLVKFRRQGELPRGTALIIDDDNIFHIYSDAGRPTRPLLIVDENENLVIATKKMWNASFTDLISHGCIEYIDALESDYIRVAQNENEIKQKHLTLEKIDQQIRECNTILKSLEELGESRKDFENNKSLAENEKVKLLKQRPFSHCDLHPSALLGIAGSLIPYASHNPGPRVAYACGHAAQALSIAHTNIGLQFDSTMRVLAFPSAPLILTEGQEIFGVREQPMGSNVIVAFMVYGGFNQEDSIIVNRASIDRGLFRMVIYKSYTGQLSDTAKERFEKPLPKPGQESKFAALNDDGTPIIGASVREGDFIIGIVRRTNNGLENKSTKAGVGQVGIIDSYVKYGNSITVKIRKYRRPVVGDKFASRHAQKGTIGQIMDEEDLPFTPQGLRPDIIINPHSIPSRMTVGMLYEMFFGMQAALDGQFINGSAFQDYDWTTVQRTLLQHGYAKTANQVMYSGIDGNILDSTVFIGPCYYYALRHHSLDKIQARATGPIQIQTRQPVHGRSKAGGIRFGEMESAGLISHGAANLLKERMFEVSDPSSIICCTKCHRAAEVVPRERKYFCKICKSTDKSDFGLCEIPFSLRTFTEDLRAAAINLTFIYKKIQPTPKPVPPKSTPHKSTPQKQSQLSKSKQSLHPPKKTLQSKKRTLKTSPPETTVPSLRGHLVPKKTPASKHPKKSNF